MQEEGSNYLGFGLFFFIIVLIIAGCSILLFLNVRSKNQEKRVSEDNEVTISDKNKVDKKENFIYFTDEEILSEELNLSYKTPIINLKSESAKNINEEIKNYVNATKGTLQNGSSDACQYNETSNILKTNFLEYATYTFQEFATLLIRESEYTCESGFSSTSKVKSYTFDVLSGERLSFQALITKYGTTLTNVLEMVRNHLNEEQTIVDETPNILIEETIGTLKEQETYVLYIDEFGDLILNYVVKTNSVDYNDTIVVNRK